MELSRLQNALPKLNSDQAKSVILSYVEISSTATGLSTFYNTKEEQNEATLAAHNAMLALDRGVYSALTTIPGTTDFSKQAVLFNLLSNPYPIQQRLSMSVSMETKLINYLLTTMPVHRVLNVFIKLAEQKQNSSRIKRIAFNYILGSGDRLDFWAVKYRKKLRQIITHCIGQRRVGILRSILNKRGKDWSYDEGDILQTFVPIELVLSNNIWNLRFILGINPDIPRDNQSKYIKAFYAAKEDIEAGKDLPPEVLEGIRSTYHPDVPKEKVLDLTKKTATAVQQVRSQKRAKKADIEIKFDPFKLNPVQLYIYAFNEGMTDEIMKTLIKKAKNTAKNMLVRHGTAGVLIDTSLSMLGGEKQKYRPISIALALCDLIQAISENCVFEYPGQDRYKYNRHKLILPSGPTNLAKGLIKLLQAPVEVIYIISDGYENQSAGRVSEVINIAKTKLNINIPIIHLNPVAASESIGVRNLTGTETISVSSPESFASNSLRTGLLTSLNSTLEAFFTKTISMLNADQKTISKEEEIIL
jgi:hypothetical protein